MEDAPRDTITTRRRDAGKLRVVVAGGGVAALEAMLALRHMGGDALAVTLVCPRDHFEYRPLAVTEPFAGVVPRYDLRALAAAGGARHLRAAVSAVDADARTVSLGVGGRLEYDYLLVAAGARPLAAVRGATPFWAGTGSGEFRSLVEEIEAGTVADAVVAVPGGASWPLPAYELALQTAHALGPEAALGRIVLATPERAPLEVFGRRIGSRVGELLRERGVEFVPGVVPQEFAHGELRLTDRILHADRVVALPRLYGPVIPGLPADADGFIPTDDRARVAGVERVFAAGDATTSQVKQGGVAAHHADIAAQAIAQAVGGRIDPTPLRPVLRAVLLTGGKPLYMRCRLADPADPHGDRAAFAEHPFWWPPGKIAGRYLAPFLATVKPLPVANVLPATA